MSAGSFAFSAAFPTASTGKLILSSLGNVHVCNRCRWIKHYECLHFFSFPFVVVSQHSLLLGIQTTPRRKLGSVCLGWGFPVHMLGLSWRNLLLGWLLAHFSREANPGK